MMTSSLTPVNNANQSYMAFLNLQTGKIISFLRNTISFLRNSISFSRNFTKYCFVFTK